MRYLLLATLTLFLSCGCDGGDTGEFAPGSKGGSGDLVEFNFECNSQEVGCPGAARADRRFHDTYEIKCAWGCALNTTEFRDTGFEELSEPAQHIFTFRKTGDECWRVDNVETNKCGEEIISKRPSGGGGGLSQSGNVL